METSQEEQTLNHRWEESETESQTLYSGKIGRGGTKGKNFRRRYGNRCRKCKKNESEEFESKHTCSMYGRDVKGKKTDPSINCLGCFMSAFQEIPFHQLPILPEALLGSFLASFLWLLREQEKAFKLPKSSKSLPPGPLTFQKEEKSDESLKTVNLSESTLQMICDICEILNEATFQELESREPSRFSLQKAKKAEKDLDLENWVSCGNRFRGRYWSPSAKDITNGERVNLKRNFVKEIPAFCSATVSSPDCLNHEKKIVESNEGSKTAVEAENESSSEEGSVFVEALSSPLKLLPQNELKSPSVTGMGDLTKAVMGKKSVSTLTATNSAMTSWVGRLSDEIQCKIRKIKSKANLRLTERSFKNSDETSNEIRAKYSENMQFTVTANTPLGFYDVMIIQYKKNRFSDRIWSEDSFHNFDLEPVWTNSNSVSAENELEEFLEIYVKDSKKKNEKLVPLQEKGVLKEMELKTHKAHFFEIQKFHPVHFVQETVQKTPTVHSVLFLEMEKSRDSINKEEISGCTEEKQKKQVVIEGSSNDLVIYIQVELEDSWSPKSSNVFKENQMNSFGTQTVEDSSESNLLISEKIIKLTETKEDGESLFHIWRKCDVGHSEDIKQKESFDKPLEVLGESNIKIKEEQLEKVRDEKVLKKQELKKNSGIFDEELSEMYIESEIKETYPDEEDEKEKITMGTSELLIMKEEKQRTDVWFFQPQVMHKLDFIIMPKSPEVSPEIIAMININDIELAKALNLIHEIENDIINVKLNDAISILPQLESELRKHLQSKIRNIEEKEPELEISVDNFFSTVDFWPEEEEEEKAGAEGNDDGSQERLNNLLKLLSDLEEAVKFSEHSSNKLETCQSGFSKIYELLHALILHIRELEEHPNVTRVSQTLEIASQLDTAVREYDNVVNKQPLNYVSSNKKMRKSISLEEIPAKYHLKNVRKKVFEIVEEEAFNLEGKIEADFDRLDRIEKENNEVMSFLETFLQKTERRMAERARLKNELKNLSSALNSMYETYREAIAKKREKDIGIEKQTLQIKRSKERSVRTKSSSELSSAPKEEFVKETVSGLLTALDNLKSRAREKNEVCKEILSSPSIEKGQGSENLRQESSISPLPAKHPNGLKSLVKEYRRIGSTSLYLSWTEPEGVLKDFIVGYQIYVNGKLNQKVRNPQRLQAILYSVELTKRIQVQLYALIENHPKTLLATLNCPKE